VRGKTVADVLQEALTAVNAYGVFVYDDVGSGMKYTVRSRGTWRDEISEDVPIELDVAENRVWDNVYDGVVVRAALHQVYTAGDTTSANARVYEVQSGILSPSFGQAVADDLYSFFKEKRKMFHLTARDAPHWEVLDQVILYQLRDAGNYECVIVGRQVDFLKNQMRIRALQV
jgi:hypothetical protein